MTITAATDPQTILSSETHQRALLGAARSSRETFRKLAPLITSCPCPRLIPLYFDALAVPCLFLVDRALAMFPHWLPLFDEGQRAEAYARVANHLENRCAMIQLRAALTLFRGYGQERMLPIAAAIVLASERHNGMNSIRGAAASLLTKAEKEVIALLMARLVAGTRIEACPPIRRLRFG